MAARSMRWQNQHSSLSERVLLTSVVETTISVAVKFGLRESPSDDQAAVVDVFPANRWSSWARIKEGVREDLVILEKEDPCAVFLKQARYLSKWATEEFVGLSFIFMIEKTIDMKIVPRQEPTRDGNTSNSNATCSFVVVVWS